MESQVMSEIKPMESNIGIHTFVTTVADKIVKFEVIKFKDSVFVWIGEKRNRLFNDLSLALLSQSTKGPVGTKIMGHPTDLTSSNLASKLSKKLGKPVYVSFNLVEDRLTVSVINARIAEEVQKNPQFF